MKKKLVLYTVTFITCILCSTSSTVCAECNKCISLIPQKFAKTETQDVHFLTLKKRVFQELSNSWCSKEKAELIMDVIFFTRPQICVEIGAFTGSSVLPAAAALQYLKQGRVYAIDAWSNEEAIKNVSKQDLNYDWWAKVDMIESQARCAKLLEQWGLLPYCSIVHSPAAKAAFLIEEIDFLHLDGSLSEQGSLLELQLFLPKVKSGGYILLSNLFLLVDKKLTKMSSMWNLLDHCEITCEIDNNNTVLFQKN